MVSEDAEGYLQTAYGTYDAMYVESIKALLSKIQKLENENQSKTKQVRSLQEQLDKTNQSLGQINQRLTALEINN